MADETQENQELSDEEALMKIASAMKDQAPTPDEKQNVHTFLHSVVTSTDTTKTGNLRDDKDLNELGIPEHHVRGDKELELISRDIMNNDFFAEHFKKAAENTLATSLSREGFLLRQATTTTKAVADVTKRRKSNKGWFGKKNTETTGGDPYSSHTNGNE